MSQRVCQGIEDFGAQANDASLVHLAPLAKLNSVDLVGTQITDAGLVHLAGLTRLEYVRLQRTQVTAAGVARLQKALPNCVIYHSLEPNP